MQVKITLTENQWQYNDNANLAIAWRNFCVVCTAVPHMSLCSGLKDLSDTIPVLV